MYTVKALPKNKSICLCMYKFSLARSLTRCGVCFEQRQHHFFPLYFFSFGLSFLRASFLCFVIFMLIAVIVFLLCARSYPFGGANNRYAQQATEPKLLVMMMMKHKEKTKHNKNQHKKPATRTNTPNNSQTDANKTRQST